MPKTAPNSMSLADRENIRLLIVDDEEDFRDAACCYFQKRGYPVSVASNGHDALDAIQNQSFDVAIVDVHMPELDGLDLLNRISQDEHDLKVIMLTGGGSIDNAVDSIKKGAFDFLTKPAKLNELDLLIQKAYRNKQLEKENRQLRHLLRIAVPDTSIVGESPEMKEVFRLIQKTAITNKPVLIQGESGTGKELVARQIHLRSQFAERPMVTVNCAALPEPLLESELFGHERGALNDALVDKPGLLEIADGGTLFIDELGELAGSLQAKLLRVLEDGSLRRVGGIKKRSVQVRIIAATNRDLGAEVDRGNFRQDLYYRINVLGINLPPLRHRQGDIESLSRHFAGSEWEMPPEVLQTLKRYSWPGNVRQLQNAIERAKVLSDGFAIKMQDLPEEIVNHTREVSEMPPASFQDLESINRNHVLQVYEKHQRNKTRTAKALGIGRRSLYRMLERFDID